STGTRHRSRPHPLAVDVGRRIRTMRDEQKFTFDAFVEECGLGRGYISELERGLVVPTIVALKRIADALHVTIADLVLGTTDRERLFEKTRALSASSIRSLHHVVDADLKKAP